MFDTATLTISGNVVADPRISGVPDDPDRVNFRVVSNRRRRDPQSGEWTDAGEYGVNVVCWRRLARGVAQSVRRGDPVLVIGRISQHDYVDAEGVRRWANEITADYVGHDLAKGAARFYRFTRLDRLDASAPATGPTASDGSDPAGGATGEPDGEHPIDDRIGADDGFDGDEAVDPFDEREPELSGV